MIKRFLHTLTAAEGHLKYLVAGTVWSGMQLTEKDSLNFYLQGEDGAFQGCLSVEAIQLGSCTAFSWEYFKKISEQLSVRNRGLADTVEEACAAVLSFAPETVVLEYLGRTFVCYGGDLGAGGKRRQWEAEIDGGLCTFAGPIIFSDKPEYYTWERTWGPASAALSFTGRGRLCGERPTLRDAIIAAVDAPELFKRACGELIATLSQPGEKAEVCCG